MTLTDPWASAPAEPAVEAPRLNEVRSSDPIGEAATAVVKPVLEGFIYSDKPTAVGTAYVDVKPRLEGFPTGDKITLTFKGAGGYGDRWLVAHVANPAEGLQLLKDPEFKELLDLSKRIATYDGAGAAPAAAAPAARPLQPGQPAGSVEAPSWAPAKPHPDFVYVTKVSPKTGKPWHAWMAPEKNDSREPVFFNAPR